MNVTCEKCGHDSFTLRRSTWESQELEHDQATGDVREVTTNVYATVLTCDDCETNYVLNRSGGHL